MCSWRPSPSPPDERGRRIAGVLAKAGWRSPLEPLAGGDVEAVWGQLSLAQKRASWQIAMCSAAHRADDAGVRP